MNKFKDRLSHPLIMWLVVLVGALVLWQIVPMGYLFDKSSFGIVVLILASINWLYVKGMALKVHRKASTSIHNIDELVTEGQYAVVRHPMYLADIILGWSILIFYPTFQILAVVIWLMAVLIFWANLEERLLEEKFLQDYRDYKQRVPMFVPRLLRRKVK